MFSEHHSSCLKGLSYLYCFPQTFLMQALMSLLRVSVSIGLQTLQLLKRFIVSLKVTASLASFGHFMTLQFLGWLPYGNFSLPCTKKSPLFYPLMKSGKTCSAPRREGYSVTLKEIQTTVSIFPQKILTTLTSFSLLFLLQLVEMKALKSLFDTCFTR